MYGSKCYKYFPQRLSWQHAKEKCREQNGNLASITSGFLTSFLQPSLGSEDIFWSGGIIDLRSNGPPLVWSDGTPFNGYWNFPQGFFSNEPRPGPVEIHTNGYWLHRTADERSYVCQKDKQGKMHYSRLK